MKTKRPKVLPIRQSELSKKAPGAYGALSEPDGMAKKAHHLHPMPSSDLTKVILLTNFKYEFLFKIN